MSESSFQSSQSQNEPPPRKRERYPPTERGVRVRIYLDAEQVHALTARGLAIECTRAAPGAEVERIRRTPGYEWLRRTLPLWLCLQVVKQACAARRRAFESGWGHPKGEAFAQAHRCRSASPTTGGKATATTFADKSIHIPAVGALKVRTVHGHMPQAMVRNPTVTVRRDACATPAHFGG